jgi:nitroreductase
MDFFDAVKARYSYRGRFKTQLIPDEHLRQIVQAALDAPSGCNMQTTEFVIVTAPGKIKELAEMAGRESMTGVPAVIVVLCDTEASRYGMRFWIEDCAAATENLLLAIAALGYASCWIDGALRREGRAERIAALLGVPKSRTVRIVLPVGVPAEPGTRQTKRPFADRAWFNAYKA